MSNIIVKDIKVGDIHYECEYGMCIKVTVVTKPVFKDGSWQWKSKTDKGDIIDYPHYASKLYDKSIYYEGI